jgi:hypothetical protein
MSCPQNHQEENEVGKTQKIKEITLCCITCPKQCEMTLLVEGFSVLFVKGEGCKKGRKFAYKELKNRRSKQGK